MHWAGLAWRLAGKQMKAYPLDLTVHQEGGYLGFSWSVASVLRTQSCARKS